MPPSFLDLIFLGGLVSDKLLGNRKAIIWGGYLQITGHLILAIPSNHLFFVGLAFVATGAGFRMAPSGSLVNNFYRKDQFRKKEDRYAMLYMIFNFSISGGAPCDLLILKMNCNCPIIIKIQAAPKPRCQLIFCPK